MRLLPLSALALAIDTAYAYLDASPFFLLSTSPEFGSGSVKSIETYREISKSVQKILLTCPTEYYIFFTQEGVTAADYRNSKTSPALASRLTRKSGNGAMRSHFIGAEMIGRPDVDGWTATLEKHCKVTPKIIDTSKDNSIPSLSQSKFITVNFASLSSSTPRADQLRKNDAYFASFLDLLPSEDYTVIYMTQPMSVLTPAWNSTGAIPSSHKEEEEVAEQYEMEEIPLLDLPHGELKRDLSPHTGAKETGNQTLIDGPLFDRYQFLTPGLYMGFGVTFLLSFILYVGLSALTGLQVTYAAFEKETGPNANKKQ